MKNLNKINSICLMILTFLALAIVFAMAKTILIPFVLSIFIWLIYSPVIIQMQTKFKLPRSLVLVFSLFGFVAIFLLITFLVGNSIEGFISGADQYSEKLNALTVQIPQVSRSLGFDIESAQLQDLLKKFPIMNFIKGLTGSMIGLASNTFLVIIFSLFLLTGESVSKRENNVLEEIKKNVRDYVSTKFFLSGLTAFLTYIVLLSFQVEMAFMFAIFTFLLNFIPNIGSLVAMLLPIPVILLQFEFGYLGFIIMALLLAIQIVIGNILEPKMMGESMGLHPVTILLFLTFWGFIWGITGMFLSVPITASLKIIFSKFEITKPIADLFCGRLPA